MATPCATSTCSTRRGPRVPNGPHGYTPGRSGAVDSRSLMFWGSADPAIPVAHQTGFRSRSVIGGHAQQAKSRYAWLGRSSAKAGRPRGNR